MKRAVFSTDDGEVATYQMLVYHFKTSIPYSLLIVEVNGVQVLESILDSASPPGFETTLNIEGGASVYVRGESDNPGLNAEAELIAKKSVSLETLGYDIQIHPEYATATISFIMPSVHVTLTSNNS